MKSEVKTNFPNSEDQKFFALGLAGRPFDGSWGVRLRRFLWASARRQPSPRIHSTVRFGERSQAHMGDSGPLHIFSSKHLRSIFLLSVCAWLARSKVIAELSSQGTSQLRGVSLPRLQAERLGLTRPPGSAAATGSFSLAAPALL